MKVSLAALACLAAPVASEIYLKEQFNDAVRYNDIILCMKYVWKKSHEASHDSFYCLNFEI